MRGASNGRSWKPGSPRTATNVISDRVVAEFASAVDAVRCAASPRRSAARCDAAPAVEPVVGHAKAERRMGRKYLKGTRRRRCQRLLAAAGFNFGVSAMARVAFAAKFIALCGGVLRP